MAPQLKKDFEAAFLSAFNKYSELERMLDYELDIQLNSISNQNKTMPEIVYDILKFAENKNKIREIIDVAVLTVSGNLKLQKLQKDLSDFHELKNQQENKSFGENYDGNQKIYNLKNIFILIDKSFNDTDLTTFCMNNFYEVYNSFGNGNKTQKVQNLIDFCTRKLQLTKLLELMKVENPPQFEVNKPYF